MKSIRFLIFPLLTSAVVAMQQGEQITVYPANAGEATRPFQQIPNEIPQANTQAGNSNTSNAFLEYYARQGNDFSAPVFYQENGNLVKRDISYDDLKKAVVIFFGDWCPHCHKFLTEFSQNIGKLTSQGIKVILLNVPSVEKLKNWQDPTMQDYQLAIQELNTCGINTANNVDVVLLGDRMALSKVGVSGLPVFLAIKNAKEYFRGIGSNGVSRLQFADPNVLKQFLDIWGESKDEVKREQKVAKSKKIKKETLKSAKAKKRTAKKTVKLSRKAMIESKTATEMLNSIPWKFNSTKR